jgi:hypothetical protein
VSSIDDLLTKARFMRNAAPRAYEEFLASFKVYTWHVNAILIDVTDNYQLYQGHAQQCKKLMQILEEARNG